MRSLRFGLVAVSVALVGPPALVAACGETSGAVIASNDAGGTPPDCANGPNYTGCSCTAGQTRPCYTGPAWTEGIGACAAGTQTCTDGAFGACQGEVVPTTTSTCLAPSADGGGTSPGDDASAACLVQTAPTLCLPICVDGEWVCPDAGVSDGSAASPDATTKSPPEDAGAACTTESDCPTGTTCGYLISLGCAATGTCVTLPPQMPCGAQVGCSATTCDGGTISWATYPSCDPAQPKGYAPAPINGTPQEPGIGVCPNY